MPHLSPAEMRQDKRPELLPIFIVFSILPMIAVAMRIIARKMKQTELWWDDYLILVALVRNGLAISSRPSSMNLIMFIGLCDRSAGFSRGR